MAADTFASVDDLQTMWRQLMGEAEEMRAEMLLGMASARIRVLMERSGTEIVAGDDDQAANLKEVCCNMVVRKMANDSADVTNRSMTAGSYTESLTYSNPSGDMYITRNEKLLLGIVDRVQAIASLHPYAEDE